MGMFVNRTSLCGSSREPLLRNVRWFGIYLLFWRTNRLPERMLLSWMQFRVCFARNGQSWKVYPLTKPQMRLIPCWRRADQQLPANNFIHIAQQLRQFAD